MLNMRLLLGFLLTLFCISISSSEAPKRRQKTSEIVEDSAEHLASPKYTNKFDEDYHKQIKTKERCKGRECKNKDDEHSNGEEEDLNYTEKFKNKYEKYDSNVKKGRTFDSNFRKSSRKSNSDEDDDNEVKTSPRKKVKENISVVKNKLDRLKKKIEDIEKYEDDSREYKSTKKGYKVRDRRDENRDKNENAHGIRKSRKELDTDNSSEEVESNKNVKRIKTPHPPRNPSASEENNSRPNFVNNGSKKIKKSKEMKIDEDDNSSEPVIIEIKNESSVKEIDENGESNIIQEACKKTKKGKKNEDDSCYNEGDDDSEEKSFHTKKYKFSIKYAHEKRKEIPIKEDRTVKRLHGSDKKNHRSWDDDDDDSEEEDELPKRLHRLIEDED
ncbi:hypothetical protein JTB14_037433 [Gonioctena quinquepunctata]|nr:hypothetical protein JTB14_037433 [Gonioctena quinquepunctata]